MCVRSLLQWTVKMSSSVVLCLALLLATNLIAISYGDQSVCTVTDEDSSPLCDGEVFHVYPSVTDERTTELLNLISAERRSSADIVSMCVWGGVCVF